MSDRIDWPNRLAKWRSWFAGWQLGTRPLGEPECDALRDHRELSIMLRAEMSAMTGLLIEKGVFTAEEFTEKFYDECHVLSLEYERRFPGVEATDVGLQMDPKMALDTMRRMNFKP